MQRSTEQSASSEQQRFSSLSEAIYSLNINLTLFSPDAERQPLIAAGCNEALLAALQKVAVQYALPIDYKMLCLHFKRIAAAATRRAQTDVDTVWKLLCLTGNANCITQAIALLQDNIIPVDPDNSPEQQLIHYYKEALNYIAYTGDIESLKAFSQLVDISTLLQNDHCTCTKLITSVAYSNDLNAVKWLVQTANMPIALLQTMPKNILIIAISLGNVNMMEYAVTACAISKNSFYDYMNVLQLAVTFGHLHVTKHIIEQWHFNHMPISEEKTLLHFAFAGGDMPTIQWLVETKKMNIRRLTVPEGDNMLHLAAKGGHIDAMRYAIKKGLAAKNANANGVTIAHYAAFSGSVPAIQFAIDQHCPFNTVFKDNIQALHYAAQSGNLPALKLVASQLPVETVKKLFTQHTELMKRIIRSNMGIPGIEYAETFGIHLPSYKTDDCDSNLLLLAAQQNHIHNLAVFNYLLAKNVKPFSNQNRTTIVHMATMSGDLELLKLAYQTLLDYLPDENPLNNVEGYQSVLQFVRRDGRDSTAVLTLLHQLHMAALLEAARSRPSLPVPGQQ
jgi:ankyrin repeat protein